VDLLDPIKNLLVKKINIFILQFLIIFIIIYLVHLLFLYKLYYSAFLNDEMKLISAF